MEFTFVKNNWKTTYSDGTKPFYILGIEKQNKYIRFDIMNFQFQIGSYIQPSVFDITHGFCFLLEWDKGFNIYFAKHKPYK